MKFLYWTGTVRIDEMCVEQLKLDILSILVCLRVVELKVDVSCHQCVLASTAFTMHHD